MISSIDAVSFEQVDGDNDPRSAAVVGIAASAGGLAALETVLESLRADFPVPIIVVQHLEPTHESHLVQILAKHTSLDVRTAANLARLSGGVVYVAPPNHHVMVNSNRRISLTSTAQVHFVRPSADVLFQSLAKEYASSAIVIVLTGTGSDGASGALAVKEQGGKVIVQDPETAAFPGMPAAAIAACDVDYVVDLADIAPTLCELVGAR